MKKLLLLVFLAVSLTGFSQQYELLPVSNFRVKTEVKPPTFNSEFTSMMSLTQDAINEMALLGMDGPEDSALSSPYLRSLMAQIKDIADGLSRFGPVPTNIDGWIEIQYAHQAGVCIQNCYKDYYECMKNYEQVQGLGNIQYLCARDFHHCVIHCN